jgi:hypothetical protein
MTALTVEILREESIDLLDDLFANFQGASIYDSTGYIRFLSSALTDVNFFCLLCREGDAPIGMLLLFEQTSVDGQRVLNSLPFFGSHGGPCWRRDVSDSDLVQEALLIALSQLAEARRAASITIVESISRPINIAIAERLGFNVVDDRIGQITNLPDEKCNTEKALFHLYHAKARNAIRKGQKLRQVFERRTDNQSLQWLQETHERSILSLGGVPKNPKIFYELLKRFPLDAGARLYIGTCDSKPVSGLLLLQHADTIEYFTPAVAEEFRELQALPALIHHALVEATRDGFQRWNWGGTWRSQTGVYRFKSRFGAFDTQYRYFLKIIDEKMTTQSPSLLREKFPYFYVTKYSS